MRIKKFVAPNIKEATAQMKEELGPEAIILHTRKVPKHGLLKSLGNELVEITAAIDEQPLAKESTFSANPGTYSKKNVKQSYDAMLNQAIQQTDDDQENAVDSLKKMTETFEQQLPSVVKAQSNSMREASDIVQLKSDVEDMKSLLQTISQQLQYKNYGDLPGTLKEAYVNLLQQDVDEKYALALTNSVLKKLQQGQTSNASVVEQSLMQSISSTLSIDHKDKSPKKNKIVVLVGPTGVGKTTTIAKLAAIEKLAHGKKVALISCDTYRIGAIEQLKTFAVIADIPMEVVYRTTDLTAALKKYQRYDVVFIDTVGRSQKAKKELQDLKKIVQMAKADEVHLVVSGQTNTATLADIVEHFSVVSPTHLIFSKLDEAAIFGPLYNIVQKTKLPVSFFTTGQAVPDDICKADGIKFAKMLYNGIYANA